MFAINGFIQFLILLAYYMKMVTEKDNQNITIFCKILTRAINSPL